MIVKAKNPDVVTLWERNDKHPNGEVFIYGGEAFEVGETDAVRKKLIAGELVEVKQTKARRKKAAAK